MPQRTPSEIEIQKVDEESLKQTIGQEKAVIKPTETDINSGPTLATEEDLIPEEEKAEELKKSIENLENEMKSGGVCGQNCGWILYCLVAGACMGCGAFLYATNFSEHGMIAVGIIGPVPFLVTFLIRVSLEIRYRVKNGSCFKKAPASRVRT